MPKPDAPATIRKLPERQEKTQSEEKVLGLDRVSPANPAADAKPPIPTTPSRASAKPAEVKPLSPARFKVTFTAGQELKDKLERLRALMRTSVPDGDLATLIEEAVTEKLERLESKRYGKTKVPRKSLEESDRSPSSRHIPAAVKRAVYERDNGQYSFVDENGCRCTETELLEFNHREPFALGGDHSLANVELRCGTHNLYQAELDYGKEVIANYRRSASRVSEPAIVYRL